jgi:hypothetical protein
MEAPAASSDVLTAAFDWATVSDAFSNLRNPWPETSGTTDTKTRRLQMNDIAIAEIRRYTKRVTVAKQKHAIE